jgi:hypothetical protein
MPDRPGVLHAHLDLRIGIVSERIELFMRTLYRTVWIASLLAILGMSVWFATQPLALPVLAPMISYVSEDKSLSFPCPGNWKPHESSSRAVATRVAFDPNVNTHFAVDTSLAGSLMGDIAKSNNAALSALPGMPPEVTDKLKSPLETLHQASLQGMAHNKTRFPDFLQGKTQPTQIGGVEAFRTEFTYTRGGVWGRTKMTGIYVTALTKEREVRVLATCTQELQKTLQPLFDEMLVGMRLGQTEG